MMIWMMVIIGVKTGQQNSCEKKDKPKKWNDNNVRKIPYIKQWIGELTCHKTVMASASCRKSCAFLFSSPPAPEIFFHCTPFSNCSLWILGFSTNGSTATVSSKIYVQISSKASRGVMPFASDVTMALSSSSFDSMPRSRVSLQSFRTAVMILLRTMAPYLFNSSAVFGDP